jgi:thymidylate synthase (FAD)
MREEKLRVYLISWTKNLQQTVSAAIRQCYSSVGAAELRKKISPPKQKELIKMVLASGHLSTLEHASFTFSIKGVSRVTEIHLIRHRLASYSIQSGRYVKRAEAGYVLPQSIKNLKKANPILFKNYLLHLGNSQKIYGELLKNGILAEDARYCQPQSLQTKIVVTMNARELLHFFQLRCCRRAQWEIREMASQMLKKVKKVAPTIFSVAGPTCETEKICWEGERSCGQWKKIKGAVLKSRV